MNPSTLTIDAGNSRIKGAVFENSEPSRAFYELNWQKVSELIKAHHDKIVLICSVINIPEYVSESLQNHPNAGILNIDHPLPFNINYQTKETLGMDRIAALAAGNALFPENAVLVINMGTCITYDGLTPDKGYIGGCISLGYTSRFRAMHDYTYKLPLIDADNSGHDIIFPGNSTNTSMITGAREGVTGEILHISSLFEKKYPGIIKIIGGGDSYYFESRLKQFKFAPFELVLYGLNRIAIYNANN